MALKHKSMAVIRLRKIPYSGLQSFFQDVFYRNEDLAVKALELLKQIYSNDLPASEWRSVINDLFNVKSISKSDELIIDAACKKYLGFHRENLVASKAKLRGRKAFKELLTKDLSVEERRVIQSYTEWNSAVTSYYSVLNKLKALGLVEKTNGYYVKSNKFRRRLDQVSGLLIGFEQELNSE